MKRLTALSILGKIQKRRLSFIQSYLLWEEGDFSGGPFKSRQKYLFFLLRNRIYFFAIGEELGLIGCLLYGRFCLIDIQRNHDGIKSRLLLKIACHRITELSPFKL